MKKAMDCKKGSCRARAVGEFITTFKGEGSSQTSIHILSNLALQANSA